MIKIIALAAAAVVFVSANGTASAHDLNPFRFLRGGHHHHHHHGAVVRTYTKNVIVKTTHYRVVPVRYKVISRPVLVRPAQRIAHHVPAIRKRVAETVMIKPARRIWTIYYDAYGRKIGCWRDKPARYATRYRTVTIRPAGVRYTVIPAQYRMVTHRTRAY
jgi:hypothetical protein